jgi:putative membrane protein
VDVLSVIRNVPKGFREEQMMRRKLIPAAFFSAALALAGCASTENSNSSTVTSNTSVNTSTTNRTATTSSSPAAGTLAPEARAFLNKAAVGGMAEVQLGQVAEKNAKSPDVKLFGRRMIEDHSKANSELTRLATTKGVTPPSELDSKHKATLDRLSKLTGDQFDKAYMADMVTDHEEDVAEFQKEANSGGDPDVKAFAAKTLPTLQEHLKLAKAIDAKLK